MNKSSIFLINDLSKGIHFPSKAFVDTNVILDLYLNRKHKNDWISFMGQATKQGTEFVYTLHSLREIRNVLNFQIHDKKAKELKVEPYKGTKAWKVLENSTKHNFSKIVANETEKVNELLQEAGFKFEAVQNSSDIFELENIYSSEFDLGPGDSAIAATMESLKINSICTNDAGFFKTDNLNFYSPTVKAFKVSRSRNNSYKEFKNLK